MERILEISFLIVAVSLFVWMIALGIYIFVKRRQYKELPEGVSAEPQQPGFPIWITAFCGLNFITSTINHFKDKESHTALFNTAYAIFITAWVLTLILMIVSLFLKNKCSITEKGIVVSSGMTTAPSACWYELEGKKLIITDRKTGYKCTYTVTGDLEKLNEILKASYTRHA